MKSKWLRICALLLSWASAAQASDLPDLVVSDFTLRLFPEAEWCDVMVTVRNQGTAPLPPPAPGLLAGDVRLRVFKDGREIGSGMNIYSEALRNPGGSVTLPFGQLSEGDAEFRAIVDHANVIAEGNEENNVLTKRLSCSPFPDLAITEIRFTSDCRVALRLANLGDTPLPDRLYEGNNSFISGWIDGAETDPTPLSMVDPEKRLKPPGGAIEWIDNSGYRANKRVRYSWRSSPTLYPPLREKNLNRANNAQEAAVPPSCLPDLVVSNLELGEMNVTYCKVFVTLRNLGPGPLPSRPLVNPELRFFMGGASFVGEIPQEAYQALTFPGGSFRWESFVQVHRDTPMGITVVVDGRGWVSEAVSEANEDNNSLHKVLTCSPPLAAEVVTPPRSKGEVFEPKTAPLSSPLSKGPVLLPDLTVANLELDENCKIFVTLRNQGPGSLPAAALSTSRPGVQFYKNNSPFGGSVLRAEEVQPLNPPGGSVRLFFNKSLDKNTIAEIRAVVDASGNIAEANEGNNSLTKVLTCGPVKVAPQPAQRQNPLQPAQPKSKLPTR